MLRARGAAMRKGAKRNAVMALALFASAHSANAHGIAGNRFFVGTLTFDDPSVADEAIVPIFRLSIIPSKLGTPSTIASIGRSPVC